MSLSPAAPISPPDVPLALAPALSAQPLPLPPKLFVPVPGSSRRATDYKPPGTRVARGEALLVTVAGAAEVPLAPAAGTIAGVREVQLLDGSRRDAVEIDVDAQQPVLGDAPVAAAAAAADPTPAPPDLPSLIERLRLGGVWADRRTSPDLLAQLNESFRRPIDTLVCNLLDVDDGSSLNARLVREHGPAIVAGAAALAKATGASKVFLAADARLADRLSVHVRKANLAARLKVVALANQYPQSDPTMLVYALSGRRLRPDKLPPEVQTVLLDGAAAAAVARCIEGGEAMLSVPVEVRDSARSKSHVLWAAVGTPLRFVLDFLNLPGGGSAHTLRGGAALRDVRLDCDAVVAGAELTVDAGPPSPPINPDPCIRCGWCVESCPVRINPAGILEAAQDSDPAQAEEWGLHACIECGICSYVCPSRLPLLAGIRHLRSAEETAKARRREDRREGEEARMEDQG